MNFYERLYYSLCRERSQLKEMYRYGSGLHRHRIVPGHMGGEYTDDNISYLSVREHVIAHYLLWKIYRSPNDLRSMKMLGANLSHSQRVIVGKWCHENKIGFHNFSDEHFIEWRARGLDTQRRNYEEHGNTNSFYYWSTEEGRQQRSSMGGKASWEYQKKHRNGLPFCISLDPEERRKNAEKGAKHSGKFPVTDGIVCKKLKTEDDRQIFLSENPSFRSGGRPYNRKTKGGRWMNKSGKSRNVAAKLVDEFLGDGWSFGRT